LHLTNANAYNESINAGSLNALY